MPGLLTVKCLSLVLAFSVRVLAVSVRVLAASVCVLAVSWLSQSVSWLLPDTIMFAPAAAQEWMVVGPTWDRVMQESQMVVVPWWRWW